MSQLTKYWVSDCEMDTTHQFASDIAAYKAEDVAWVVKVVREALALADSMIRGGEHHTEQSSKQISEALALLKEPS